MDTNRIMMAVIIVLLVVNLYFTYSVQGEVNRMQEYKTTLFNAALAVDQSVFDSTGYILDEMDKTEDRLEKKIDQKCGP